MVIPPLHISALHKPETKNPAVLGQVFFIRKIPSRWNAKNAPVMGHVFGTHWSLSMEAGNQREGTNKVGEIQ